MDPDNRRTYAASAKANESKAAEIAEKLPETADYSASGNIIKAKKPETAEKRLRHIGIIDQQKFKSVADDIMTDEVILTDERVEHIKTNHPNDYELYYKYMKECVESPDYIIEANKPKSAVLLKAITDEDNRLQLILRLNTSTDNPEYKNSIITFMRIRKKEWDRLLRNKKILYKAE